MPSISERIRKILQGDKDKKKKGNRNKTPAERRAEESTRGLPRGPRRDLLIDQETEEGGGMSAEERRRKREQRRRRNR